MISIVLPVYNAEQHISNAIFSIKQQTYSKYELIVIDDGSTDNTPAVIHRLQQQDSRIRILSLPKNKGIVHALNLGIENSSFSYIARMDADDFNHPTRLEKQIKFLLANPDIDVVSCLVTCKLNTDNEGMQKFVAWTNTLVTDQQIYTSRFVESPIIHPTVVFRKSIINKYGSYKNGDFPEDYELWLRWMHCGVRIHKIPEYLFTWNDPPQRLTRTDHRYRVEAFYLCKTKYLALWLREHNITQIVIWGAGKKSRKRAQLLYKHKINIVGYIDVDTKKIGKTFQNRYVWHYDNDFSCYKKYFILSYVSNQGIRDEIIQFLEKRGLKNHHNFIIAS